MKIIFLDIDGVLVTHSSARASGKVFPDFYQPCVMCLNEIIKKSNAKIVISSTWRHAHPKYLDLILFFEEQKVKGEIIGMTRIGDSAHRGIKIMAWLADWRMSGTLISGGKIEMNEKIESYVIIDDTDVRPWDKLVQTNMETGLTPKDIEKALSILNNS